MTGRFVKHSCSLFRITFGTRILREIRLITIIIKEGCEIIHECYCTMPHVHIMTHCPLVNGGKFIDRHLLLSVCAVAMADTGSPSVGLSENEASDTHSSAGMTQFRFSVEQKKTLMDYWEKGIQTCSRSSYSNYGQGVCHHCWMHCGASKGELGGEVGT